MAESKEKDTDLTEGPVIVTPDTKAPVIVGGTTLTVFEGSDSIFCNALSSEMTPEDRAAATRKVLQKSDIVEDRLRLIRGEMLYEIYENGYWRDYEFQDEDTGKTRKFATFEEFARVEVGISDNTARYLRRVYFKYCVELALPREELQDLQWTKAVKLEPFINKDNWRGLLDKMRGMTKVEVKALADELNPHKRPKITESFGTSSSGGGDTSEPFDKFNFRVPREMSSAINDALELCGPMCGSEDRATQLHFICTDFNGMAKTSGLEGGLDALEVIMGHLELAFHVQLKIENVDEEHYAKLRDKDEDEEGAHCGDPDCEQCNQKYGDL